MATETEKQAEATSAAATAGLSLLDEVVSAYKQTPRDEAEDLLRTLTEEALKARACERTSPEGAPLSPTVK